MIDAPSKQSTKAIHRIILTMLALVFCFVTISSLISPQRKSITYDEAYHYQSGLSILSGKPSERGLDNVPFRNILPASAIYPTFNSLFREALGSIYPPLAATNVHDGQIHSSRFITIGIALFLALLVFSWSRKLYGASSAIFAAALLLLDPTIIAHSRFITQDVPSSFIIFAAVYALWRGLSSKQVGWHGLSILLFAIAQICRFSSVYLLPVFILTALTFYFPDILSSIQSKTLSKLVGPAMKKVTLFTLSLLTITLLVINLGYSFDRSPVSLEELKLESSVLRSLQKSPIGNIALPVPAAYILGFDWANHKREDGYGSAASYLLGENGLVEGQKIGFLSYYLVALGLKLPLTTILLLTIAILGLTRRREQTFWKKEACLLAPVFLYLIVFSLANAQLGVRYVLMIFPFLFVLASGALKDWSNFSSWSKATSICLLIWLAISSFSYHPHYIPYFNELVPGRINGYKYLADSNLEWGQNNNYISTYLENHPGVKQVKTLSDIEPGQFLVGANELVGITAPVEEFFWIRKNLKPVDQIAYGHLVFSIEKEELRSARRQKKRMRGKPTP